MKTKIIILMSIFALMFFCRNEKALENKEDYKIVSAEDQIKNLYKNQEYPILNLKKYD